ncbi:ribonuclease H-like [Bactrocera neohumeralis]|uniref:ribonuclease H-like n=1 Tax=Bactrocera neohumeralis TaxID=98809 RepID=UPI0021669347|nr:ribonuclease H-like [Bactrocera neohumeralis]
MEFQGIILPLEEIQVPSEIEVVTDSQYVINSMTKWIYGWERKGWIKGDGNPVGNLDLIKRLQALMRYHSIKFTWVRGHSGDYYNEICDQLALQAAKSPTEVDVGFLSRLK